MNRLQSISILSLLLPVLFLWSCSSSRHVPKGSFLLDNINIDVNDTTGMVKARDMSLYLRQQPNHKIFWSTKFRLGIYNMSGRDSTKWWNKWIRRLGEAPVIYDSLLTQEGVDQLRKALVNKGFIHAEVSADTIRNDKKRKIKVNYNLKPGTPYEINTISYQFPDTAIKNIVLSDSASLPVKSGNYLDRDLLELQREFITRKFRDQGYYAFSKEYITFNADTTSGSNMVDLTMTINPPLIAPGSASSAHEEYVIRNVCFIPDFNPAADITIPEIVNGSKKQFYKGIDFAYSGNEYLRPGILYENCFIRPGSVYRQSDVERTYRALSRFTILKFINIKFLPAGEADGIGILDAYILLTPAKSQSISLELEGTNSEGDLGVAAGLSYTHRNIGKGSETLELKFRGAYESLSGDLEGLLNDRYMEYSVDMGLTFPKFKAPFLSENFKRKVNATTEVRLSMSYQERPEYTRVISTAGWSYSWIHNRNRNRYLFTPIDINYVYLPKSTYDFLDQIAPDNPLLRYSYEDHFIMDMGFSFYHTNKKSSTPLPTSIQDGIYTIRANIEFAGNLLYLLNMIFRPRTHVSENPYKLFGIYYSQYMKLNSDFSYLKVLDTRNSLAFHAGFGIGFPYGNSTILPFEKRFYGGGANGVRGWDVRTLGPGSFPNSNSVSDFINQCGDIRLILSAELRTKLFWVLELAAFIDAGNIWTIKQYDNQPGGLFYFDRFYKQLAVAYGLGLRLDFSYFLIRFDLGMKAHNPAMGRVHWPLIHPNWHRDSSFHFSIGYPF